MQDDKNLKDHQIKNLEFDKYLKKCNSGYSFFSFISENDVYVVGYLNDYVNIQDSVEEASLIEIPSQYKSVIELLTEYNFPIWKIKRIPNYVPISVSTYRFNIAILYKKTFFKTYPKEEFRDLNDIFTEIKSSLKSKNLNFQTFFFDYMTNEILFSGAYLSDIDAYNKFQYNETDLKDKLIDLVSISEKYTVLINKLLDKLRLVGISVNGKVDLNEFYSLLYDEVNFPLTKIVLLGEIIGSSYANLKKTDYFENWKQIYESTLIHESNFVSLPIKQVEVGDSHVLMLTMDGMLFSWGNGESGVTGNGNFKFHLKPQKVKFQNNFTLITRIAAGGKHNIAIDNNSIIYSWGIGKNGRLGHDNDKDVLYPKSIETLSSLKVKACSAGDTYSCCISQSNELYTWGSGEFGRLGHEGNSDIYYPKLVEDIENKVILANCHHYALVVITEKEQLIIGSKSLFMKNDLLETNKNNSDPLAPILYEVSDKIKGLDLKSINKSQREIIHVSAGYQFLSCIISEDKSKEEIKSSLNKESQATTPLSIIQTIKEKKEVKPKEIINQLYVWGNMNLVVNNDSSNKFENNIKISEMDFETIAFDLKNKLTNQKKKIELMKKKEKENIIDNNKDQYEKIEKELNIQAQQLENNYSEWLKTEKIKLNNGISQFSTALSCVKTLLQVEDDNKNKDEDKMQFGAKKVICSDNNTMILGHDGNVYSFGSYLFKTANEKFNYYFYPVQPKGMKINHIGLGSNHALLVTNNMEVLGIGRNKEGQLGLGNSSFMVETYTVINKLKSRGVKKVYCCENYSAALTYNNELFLFGDISFIENSQHINFQLSPKIFNWGEVLKIALGPTHILFICKDHEDRVHLKAIGNGTYGKLGDGNEREENRYEPTKVLLQFPSTFSENDKYSNTKIKCSRNNSAALVYDEQNNKRTLYVWGLYPKTIFSLRELEKISTKNNTKIKRNIKESMVIQPKPMQAGLWEDVYKVYLSETSIYVISSKNEVRSLGNFLTIASNNKTIKLNIPSDFIKLSIGLDHAAGISTSDNKVYTWGYNILNKLGIITDYNIDFSKFSNEHNNFDTYSKYLYISPQNVVELNKMFDAQKKAFLNQNINQNLNEDQATTRPYSEVSITPKENKDLFASNNNAMNANTNTKLDDNKDDDKNKDKKNQDSVVDNIFVQTQNTLVKYYDDTITTLQNKEYNFKPQLKNILSGYKFLIENENTSANLLLVLFTQFNFKFGDEPINIKFKTTNESKVPPCFIKYEKNYKALLTTLKMHPCYLIKLYSKSLMTNKELYGIIKDLYNRLFFDKYSKCLFTTLTKEIFKLELEKEKEKMLKQQNNNNNEGAENKEFLENYKLFKVESGNIEFTLVGRLCKRFFKLQKDLKKKLELFAIYLISFIFQKVGSRGTGFDLEKAMLIVPAPSKKKKESDNVEAPSNIVNTRVELLYSVIEWFLNLVSMELKDVEVIKDTLYSVNKNKYGPDVSQSGLFLKFNDMTLLFINELKQILIEFMGEREKSKVEDWMIRNFGMIIFDQLITILTNPEKKLLVDAAILIDKNVYSNFMKKSLNSFYSLSFALKQLVIILSGEDTSGETDSSNRLIKRLYECKVSLYKGLRKVFDYGDEALNKSNLRLDLIMMKSFFEHSIEDQNNTILFSLYKLRRLQEVIPYNIDDLRVLNKGYDLMDIVFFNSNQNYYIGLEPDLDLSKSGIGLDNDIIVPINLKTRSLAYVNPQMIMRCQHCFCFLLDEFNLANEQMFFEEFRFIPNSSKEGSLIKIFKIIDPIRSDKIIDQLKEELKKNDDIRLKDSLYFLCTVIALEQKETLLLEESDISNPDKLINLILSDKNTNNKISEYCREINNKFEEMKQHMTYYTQLERTLGEIKELTSKENLKSKKFKCDLYEELRINIEKGIGNPDMCRFMNSLNSSAMIVQLTKYLKSKPKSKNLFEKLGPAQKSKLLPCKEFNLKKLYRNKVIYSVLMEDCDADRK